jgi:hypothetical protein
VCELPTSDACAFHPLLLLWVIGRLGYNEEREMLFARILWELGGFCTLLALGTPVIPLKHWLGHTLAT